MNVCYCNVKSHDLYLSTPPAVFSTASEHWTGEQGYAYMYSFMTAGSHICSTVNSTGLGMRLLYSSKGASSRRRLDALLHDASDKHWGEKAWVHGYLTPALRPGTFLLQHTILMWEPSSITTNITLTHHINNVILYITTINTNTTSKLLPKW